MSSLPSSSAPMPGESLGNYVQRLRHELGLTQKEVAAKAGIHPQSFGKLERDQTGQLNRKTKRGLAYALGISEEYLDAVSKGLEIPEVQGLQFCPQCWVPGTSPHALWMHLQARYCLFCGTALRNRCISCDEPIGSLKHRFCPYCGTAYNASAEPTRPSE